MNIYHTHHIIPKHMGGTDDPSNLIRLSVEEHAEAHKALYEQHNKIEDLWAYQLLIGQLKHSEGIKLLLSKNAYDTHRKQKEKGSGIYNSLLQSEKGKKAALSTKKIRKERFTCTNPNNTRMCCISCKKETTAPAFSRYHSKKCF